MPDLYHTAAALTGISLPSAEDIYKRMQEAAGKDASFLDFLTKDDTPFRQRQRLFAAVYLLLRQLDPELFNPSLSTVAALQLALNLQHDLGRPVQNKKAVLEETFEKVASKFNLDIKTLLLSSRPRRCLLAPTQCYA